MKIRLVMLALAVLFFFVGLFLVRGAHADPAPRDSWQTYRGPFQKVVFTDTSKVGRRAVVTIDNKEEPTFALNDTRRYPGFEKKVSTIPPGTELEIEVVSRTQAGWAAPEGEPLALLVLRQGDEIIDDRDRDQTGGEWIEQAVRIFGWLAIGLSALLAALAFKKTNNQGA